MMMNIETLAEEFSTIFGIPIDESVGKKRKNLGDIYDLLTQSTKDSRFSLMPEETLFVQLDDGTHCASVLRDGKTYHRGILLQHFGELANCPVAMASFVTDIDVPLSDEAGGKWVVHVRISRSDDRNWQMRITDVSMPAAAWEHIHQLNTDGQGWMSGDHPDELMKFLNPLVIE